MRETDEQRSRTGAPNGQMTKSAVFSVTLCNAQLVLYEGRNREKYLELQCWQEIRACIQLTACLRAEEDTFQEGKISIQLRMRLVGKRLLSVVAA